jgi:hypothetical protein
VSGLFDAFYPSILHKNIPKSILECLKSSLEEDPRRRTSFQKMFDALASDRVMFEDEEDQSGGQEMLEDAVSDILTADTAKRSG